MCISFTKFLFPFSQDLPDQMNEQEMLLVAIIWLPIETRLRLEEFEIFLNHYYQKIDKLFKDVYILYSYIWEMLWKIKYNQQHYTSDESIQILYLNS